MIIYTTHCNIFKTLNKTSFQVIPLAHPQDVHSRQAFQDARKTDEMCIEMRKSSKMLKNKIFGKTIKTYILNVGVLGKCTEHILSACVLGKCTEHIFNAGVLGKCSEHYKKYQTARLIRISCTLTEYGVTQNWKHIVPHHSSLNR